MRDEISKISHDIKNNLLLDKQQRIKVQFNLFHGKGKGRSKGKKKKK